LIDRSGDATPEVGKIGNAQASLPTTPGALAPLGWSLARVTTPAPAW